MKGELQPRLVSHGVNEANIGKQPLRCREFSESREERNRREREGGGEGVGNSLTKLNFVIIAGTVSSPLEGLSLPRCTTGSVHKGRKQPLLGSYRTEPVASLISANSIWKSGSEICRRNHCERS